MCPNSEQIRYYGFGRTLYLNGVQILLYGTKYFLKFDRIEVIKLGRKNKI